MPENWKEEAFARFVENRRRTDAAESQRRASQGEFTIYLETAADDPGLSDASIQRELADFGSTLRRAEIPFSQLAVAFDSINAGGHPLAEFVIKEGMPVATAAVGGVAGWLAARVGRKVRIKAGEFEAEASTPGEAERLLKIAVETVAVAREEPPSK